jgi:nitrate reductase gamma subunit
MFRTSWIFAGTIAFALLAGASARAQETIAATNASQFPAWTRVQRVADKDAPVVSFSHSAHSGAGVSCEQCHHAGAQGGEALACITCHSGDQAMDVMHQACITCHQKSGKGPALCSNCHTQGQASFAWIVRFQLYDIVRGPLFILAWLLFAAGFAWRIVLFRRLTRRGRGQGSAPPPAAEISTSRSVSSDREFLGRGMSHARRLLFRARKWIRRTVFGGTPVMGVVSLVFHLALFFIPLLLPAHNILFFRNFGVSLPTLPPALLDWMTLGLLAIAFFFLLRRIFLPRVRALATLRDYLILLLVAAPFVTAYMAYHQWLDYRTVLVIHMIVGEIVIAAIPFTKLAHMPFLIFSRFFMSSEYAWRPGSGRW